MLIFSLFLASPFLLMGVVGIASGVVEFIESSDVGKALEIIAISLAVSLIPLTILMILAKNYGMGTLVFDEKGMSHKVVLSKKKSINWNEIKHVQVMPPPEYFDQGFGGEEVPCPKHLVFAKNEIFNDLDSNVKFNFCIFDKSPKIWNVMKMYLQEFIAAYQQEIKKFFESTVDKSKAKEVAK